jgi:hypothetical protein
VGVFDQVFRSERLVRKLRIVDDAERAGSVVVRALDDIAGAVGFCFLNGSARHFYGEVHTQGTALEGLLTQPGEHHAILPCSAPAPAAFFVAQNAWWSPDPALAWSLQQTEAALGLGAQNWRWHRRGPGGRSYFDAEWCAQIRPCAGGTHLVLRALQAGLSHARWTGMTYLPHVASALQAALRGAPMGVDTPEMRLTSFGEVALDALAETWDAPGEPEDATSLLSAGLARFAGGDVSIAPLSQKQIGIAHRFMPPGAAHLPILAMLGTPGLLNAADISVVTPTHCFVAWDEGRASFPWSEIADVFEPEYDRGVCLVRTDRLGLIGVPSGGKARALAALLGELASARAQVDETGDEEDEHDESEDDEGAS